MGPRPETVDAILDRIDGRRVWGDGNQVVRRLRSPQQAEPGAVVVVHRRPALNDLADGATLVVVAENLAPEIHRRRCQVLATAANPLKALAQLGQLYRGPMVGPDGLDPSRRVHPTAYLAPGVRVGPFAVVGAHARIGSDAVLHAGAHVGAHCEIGPGTILYDHAVVRERCRVGARCVLHAGSIIGSDGFGFAPVGPGHHQRLPQLGWVELEDEVEVGANSCIDRGTFVPTRIGAGTKIDNLVQVGHNAQVGPGSLLIAQSGVAGSSRLGPDVILAAQAGVAGHLCVGQGAVVTAQSGVAKDVPPGTVVAGSPAQPRRRYFRILGRLRQLEELFNRVRALERQR